MMIHKHPLQSDQEIASDNCNMLMDRATGIDECKLASHHNP